MIDLEKLKKHSSDVIEAIRAVHKEIGPNLYEDLYQEGLKIELSEREIPFEKDYLFHPSYHGVKMDISYKVDFLVKNDIIVEIKSTEDGLNDEDKKKLLNYMKISQVAVGIMVNFYPNYAEIEQYFFSSEKQRFYGFDRTALMNLYK